MEAYARETSGSFPEQETGALLALFEQLRPRIRGILKRSRIPPDEAEDLVQNVLLSAVESWAQIECKEAWVIRVLCYHCIEFNRRRRSQEGFDLPLLYADSVEDGRTRPNALDATLDLEDLLRRLPHRSRNALLLRFGLGMRHDEVAQQLGLKADSARRRVYRGLQHLRRFAAEGLIR